MLDWQLCQICYPLEIKLLLLLLLLLLLSLSTKRQISMCNSVLRSTAVTQHVVNVELMSLLLLNSIKPRFIC